MTVQIGRECEQDYCTDKSTFYDAANYGMCDGHYKGSLWYCERCKSNEGYWCWHKTKEEL